MVNKLKEARRIEKEKDIAFSAAVKQRDGYQCVICGSRGPLNCHHLIPREDRNWRWVMENCTTLCVLHHRFSLECSPHRNAFAFFAWMIKNRPEQLKAIGFPI